MTLTLEQFQKDAKPWLAKLKETGESLLLLSGEETYELRTASPIHADPAPCDLRKLLPMRDIIVGDPDDLVHIDWSYPRQRANRFLGPATTEARVSAELMKFLTIWTIPGWPWSCRPVSSSPPPRRAVPRLFQCAFRTTVPELTGITHRNLRPKISQKKFQNIPCQSGQNGYFLARVWAAA